MFLEEKNSRESYIVSFQINSSHKKEELSEKWIIDFYIRSYRLEIEVWLKVFTKDRVLASVVSKRRHWEGRTKYKDSNLIKWAQGGDCIGTTRKRLKETKLVRVDKLSKLQGRKAKQGWRAKVWYDICKVELKFILG